MDKENVIDDRQIETYIQWISIQPLKKKKGILSFLKTRMKLGGIMLSEIRQREKEKY